MQNSLGSVGLVRVVTTLNQFTLAISKVGGDFGVSIIRTENSNEFLVKN